MKKILAVLVLSPLFFVAEAQVDTFSLCNMPGNYFLGDDWMDYDTYCDTFCTGHSIYHSDGSHCCGAALSSEALICAYHRVTDAEYGLFRYLIMDSIEGVNSWEQSHIFNFAAGKHSDNEIKVAGVAMLYPRYKTGSNVEDTNFICFRIRDRFLSFGYETLNLQLMDSNKNVLAEGSSPLADSVGKPIFCFNKNRREIGDIVNVFTSSGYGCGDGSWYIFYDIYEAYFNSPVTVQDSFYLAARFTSSAYGKTDLGVAIPGIYEFHSLFYGIDYQTNEYFLPDLTWYARGGYRTEWDNVNHVNVYEPVPDSLWFTLEQCEPNHGYMLIFPILEVECGVPEELSWGPMGGGNVLVRWNQGDWVSLWEVSYGPEGTQPGEGRVVETTQPSAMLPSLSSDTNYVAYVRSRCTVRDTMWSDWSDSVSIPMSDIHHRQGIASRGEGAWVTLQPNPTTGVIAVQASAPVERVEVYNIHGARVCGTTGAAVDLTGCAAGVYMFRITTADGTVMRRAVLR